MPIIVIVIAIVAFFVLFTWLIPVQLWIAALAAGVKVGIFNLIAMRLRRVPPPVIVNSMIMAHKAGLGLSSDRLEAHYLAGGNVVQVVKALIAADKAGIYLAQALYQWVPDKDPLAEG